MKTKIQLLVLLLSVSIFSCDNATKDALPVLEIQFETGPNIPFNVNPTKALGETVTDVTLERSPQVSILLR